MHCVKWEDGVYGGYNPLPKKKKNFSPPSRTFLVYV